MSLNAWSLPRCSNRVELHGYTVMADKGFAGAEFEAHMATLGANFLRPDRKDEPPRHGSLGPVRQWIESVFWTCKGQFTSKPTEAARSKACAPASRCDCSLSPPACWHNWLDRPARAAATPANCGWVGKRGADRAAGPPAPCRAWAL